MSTITGGLRVRFILDSLALAVEETLAGLGWLDPNRAHRPIRFTTRLVSDEPVEPNTVAISATSTEANDFEVGSDLLQDTIFATIAFYAQNDALGIHVTADLYDALRGRLPGATPNGQLAILDLRMATPAPIGYATLHDLTTVRDVAPSSAIWERHLFSVMCLIDDFHYGT